MRYHEVTAKGILSAGNALHGKLPLSLSFTPGLRSAAARTRQGGLQTGKGGIARTAAPLSSPLSRHGALRAEGSYRKHYL